MDGLEIEDLEIFEELDGDFNIVFEGDLDIPEGDLGEREFVDLDGE